MCAYAARIELTKFNIGMKTVLVRFVANPKRNAEAADFGEP